MIIFYDKKNGNIIGTIDGRVHNDRQLSTSISTSTTKSEDVGKIVCQWKRIAKDSEIYEPEHEQKDIFIELDSSPIKVYSYRVDTSSLRLIKK